MDKVVKPKISVVWLRRDLRVVDNAALYHALKGDFPVLLLFIFDKNILEKLSHAEDRRVDFIHQQLEKINSEAGKKGSSVIVLHDFPKKAFERVLMEFDVADVYANRDYEPYARERDQEISRYLSSRKIPFKTFKDQVIWEGSEILKSDASPYTVFTPYANKWKEGLQWSSVEEYPSEGFLERLYKMEGREVPSLKEIRFRKTGFKMENPDLSEVFLQNYDRTRNLPALEGTSRVGVHLRFGTVSIRELVKLALRNSDRWLAELIWREFFMMILYHFPEVEKNNFRRKYDRIEWRNNEKEFDLWTRGKTGYPLVDAGMRQLNETGWMHNRVRMVVAGFLTKHLLIDWRWGEAYFAEKLVDYELASNNGNWQWAAGTGCDAAPYFRIFNPSTQIKKFDPKLEYVKTWIKDYRADYLSPIVDHSFARARALDAYKKASR